MIGTALLNVTTGTHTYRMTVRQNLDGRLRGMLQDISICLSVRPTVFLSVYNNSHIRISITGTALLNVTTATRTYRMTAQQRLDGRLRGVL